ncbi:MAG: AMIN domain-containing protein, partial [Desulfovibrionaceae bacterium]
KPAQTVPAEKAEKVAPKVNGPKIINKISVSATENGATVRIAGASSLNYRTMHLKNPDRIVVDLEGIWAVKAPGVPTNKAVKNVRIGKQGNKTRIVIDLSTPPASIAFVKANAETLEVRVK